MIFSQLFLGLDPSVKKILIVESDPYLKLNLFEKLKNWGCDCHLATTSNQVDELIDKRLFDVVILGSALEHCQKIGLIKYLNCEAFNTKILVIYDASHSFQLVEVFQAGADDCVQKQVSLQEMLLRTCRLFGYQKIQNSNCLQTKYLSLFPETGVLKISRGPEMAVRKRESEILACLIRYKNKVVTRETLIKYVWGTTKLPTYTTVDVYIRRIRLLFPQYPVITTIRGFGYMIKD